MVSIQLPGPGAATIIAAAVAAYAISQEGEQLFKWLLFGLSCFFAVLFIWIEYESFKERAHT